jgi:hypothetical protein
MTTVNLNLTNPPPPSKLTNGMSGNKQWVKLNVGGEFMNIMQD